MKTFIKFIISASLTITAILITSNTNAQRPYITPEHYQVNMYEGEIRNVQFQIHNGTLEDLQRMNETDDPIVAMRFKEFYKGSTNFKIGFTAASLAGANHLVQFALKAVLRGVPGIGIVFFAIDILIAVFSADYATAPILLLPMLATIGQLTINRKESKRKRINIPANLAFA